MNVKYENQILNAETCITDDLVIRLGVGYKKKGVCDHLANMPRLEEEMSTETGLDTSELDPRLQVLPIFQGKFMQSLYLSNVDKFI